MSCVSCHSITLQLNHQTSSLQTQLKRTTLSKVSIHFGRMANDIRQMLVLTNKYWYEISQVSAKISSQMQFR